MEIRHHGAVDGVTGSCHELVLAAGRSLLVDCGLFQGGEAAAGGASAERLGIDFPVDPIEALVVTHVHIDHVGRLPYLLAAGYRGPVLCSPASAELLPLVLEDALKVGVTRNARLIEQVLALLRRRTVAVPYGVWHPVSEGLRIRLQRAGHILGSAYVECAVAADGGPEQRVVFSGDLGAPNTPLLPAPQSPERADVLVLESTYGDRRHEDRATRVARLRGAVEHALRDGGTVLIPAFSIGRTQELLYELEGLFHDHGPGAQGRAGQPRQAWQGLQVVLDSPLAADFTAGYRRLRRYWDDEARGRLVAGRHPLAFEQLVTVEHHGDHLRMVDYLARSHQPAAVIAASGMCAGGRIVNYLKAMLGDPRHDILFVGYQAVGTPGRDIQRYGPHGGYVVLDGERYDIRAQVHTIGGYSAHADQHDLIDFVVGIPTPPREIRLVHGEAQAKAALAVELRGRLGPGTRVQVPGG
ncbi:MBL fold metallo-hydrolase RNA specificity domain-containing protein [Thiococcus pfennigii]|uniref:MBL fold metallo-hydrolase RNA specificity domain-containing protein n=1 Tax=Thiococcus pfennigii TaxID=1057 RepID=UPI0019076C7E|nr:MBL fold metallo-hydrolase [Thiococcus pfennigii]MBK1702084.1 MBL fold hydrolase [Thiococcus pfennigii]